MGSCLGKCLCCFNHDLWSHVSSLSPNNSTTSSKRWLFCPSSETHPGILSTSESTTASTTGLFQQPRQSSPALFSSMFFRTHTNTRVSRSKLCRVFSHRKRCFAEKTSFFRASSTCNDHQQHHRRKASIIPCSSNSILHRSGSDSSLEFEHLVYDSFDIPEPNEGAIQLELKPPTVSSLVQYKDSFRKISPAKISVGYNRYIEDSVEFRSPSSSRTSSKAVNVMITKSCKEQQNEDQYLTRFIGNTSANTFSCTTTFSGKDWSPKRVNWKHEKDGNKNSAFISTCDSCASENSFHSPDCISEATTCISSQNKSRKCFFTGGHQERDQLETSQKPIPFKQFPSIETMSLQDCSCHEALHSQHHQKGYQFLPDAQSSHRSLKRDSDCSSSKEYTPLIDECHYQALYKSHEEHLKPSSTIHSTDNFDTSLELITNAARKLSHERVLESCQRPQCTSEKKRKGYESQEDKKRSVPSRNTPDNIKGQEAKREETAQSPVLCLTPSTLMQDYINSPISPSGPEDVGSIDMEWDDYDQGQIKDDSD